MDAGSTWHTWLRKGLPVWTLKINFCSLLSCSGGRWQRWYRVLWAELRGQMLPCKTWHGPLGMGLSGKEWSIYLNSKSLSEERLTIECNHTMVLKERKKDVSRQWKKSLCIWYNQQSFMKYQTNRWTVFQSYMFNSLHKATSYSSCSGWLTCWHEITMNRCNTI